MAQRNLAPHWWVMLMLGCTTAQGTATASLEQLQARSAIDTSCPAHLLRIHRVDGRTAAVDGCGSRIVYVESCQSIRGDERCTWQIDARYEARSSTSAPCPLSASATLIPNPKGVLNDRD